MRSTKNKKGLSTIISTVLLVGFVIILGIAITTWGTKLVKRNLEKSESRIGTDLDCLNVNVKVISGSGTTVFVENNNLKEKELTGFISRYDVGNKIFVDYKNQGTVVNAFGAVPLDYSFAKDRNGVNEGGYSGSPDKIEVIPQVKLEKGEVVDCVKKTAIYAL
ncbi:MAG: hypothetical protein CMH62_02335 [Nanoarchaeota archaeon]|nr:hypothetical protein [Nanoarchaeota archaeon]|tara:strand:- start:753 stop:1241 length:489 start_codon:yes stop_codon:yes gene_type:complete